MKTDKIVVRFEGKKKFYDLTKEYVIYEIERENEGYNSIGKDYESPESKLGNTGGEEVRI